VARERSRRPDLHGRNSAGRAAARGLRTHRAGTGPGTAAQPRTRRRRRPAARPRRTMEQPRTPARTKHHAPDDTCGRHHPTRGLGRTRAGTRHASCRAGPSIPRGEPRSGKWDFALRCRTSDDARRAPHRVDIPAGRHARRQHRPGRQPEAAARTSGADPAARDRVRPRRTLGRLGHRRPRRENLPRHLRPLTDQPAPRPSHSRHRFHRHHHPRRGAHRRPLEGASSTVVSYAPNDAEPGPKAAGPGGCLTWLRVVQPAGRPGRRSQCDDAASTAGPVTPIALAALRRPGWLPPTAAATRIRSASLTSTGRPHRPPRRAGSRRRCRPQGHDLRRAVAGRAADRPARPRHWQTPPRPRRVRRRDQRRPRRASKRGRSRSDYRPRTLRTVVRECPVVRAIAFSVMPAASALRIRSSRPSTAAR
jgi:hypothetical protein